MSIHEPDIHNFSSSSSHRLPTISGTQALQNALKKAKGISTSLPGLDRALSSPGSSTANLGIQRGCLTEIYGPPGVGKTTFALQLAVNALHLFERPSHVVWINTGSPLVQKRFNDILSSYMLPEGQEVPSSPPQPQANYSVHEGFKYLEVQSLPRLLTLLMHPTAIFPPADTCLVIVDDLSNVIFGSFPRALRTKNPSIPAVQEKLAQKAAGRRYQIVENLGAALSKLAVSRNMAVAILSNATISIKTGHRASLKAALAGPAWDTSVHTRIMLYRDFSPPEYRKKLTPKVRRGYRLAEVVRHARKDVLRDPVPFVIEIAGLRAIKLETLPEATISSLRSADDGYEMNVLHPQSSTYDTVPLNALAADTRPEKRKAIEIADSDDEDEDDDDDDDKAAILSDDEPQLPPIPAPLPTQADEEQEEMLLESYERHIVAVDEAKSQAERK